MGHGGPRLSLFEPFPRPTAVVWAPPRRAVCNGEEGKEGGRQVPLQLSAGERHSVAESFWGVAGGARGRSSTAESVFLRLP